MNGTRRAPYAAISSKIRRGLRNKTGVTFDAEQVRAIMQTGFAERLFKLELDELLNREGDDGTGERDATPTPGEGAS